MKKKIVSLALAMSFLLPSIFVLSACEDEHKWNKITYAYDENGSYCSYKACDDCDKLGKKIEVIVEGVSTTNAILNGTGVSEIKNDTTFSIDMPFDDAVSALNARSANGHNTAFVKTVINSSEKPGLPLSGDIKLTEDITIGYNGNSTLCFHILDNITLDLNGHTITQACGTDGMSGYALFIVREGATLNIIDSSANHDGKINAVMSAIQVNGTVNLYDGIVKCGATMTATDVTEEYFCVWTVAMNGGTFNQYGGTVTTVDTRNVRGGGTYTATIDNYSFASYGTGTINLYRGTVVGDYDETASTQITDSRESNS